MNTFWDEKAYYLHTLNNILLTQGLLDGIGCEWYMTSMTDQSKLSVEISGRTVDGEHADEQGGFFHVWEKSPELLDYRERIWTERSDKWVLPIMEVCKQMPDDHWWFKFDKNNPNEKTFRRDREDKWMEPHPSVKQHAAWVLELKKVLGEDPVLTPEQEIFVQEFIDLKAQDETYNDFDSKIKQTSWGFEPKYRGF
jgi:hypothetical protein